MQSVISPVHISLTSDLTETTLGAQSELIKRSILASLLDTGHNRFLRLELGVLRGYKAKNNGLALWQESQRFEVSGSRVVEFEEVDVDVQLLEENLGDCAMTS